VKTKGLAAVALLAVCLGASGCSAKDTAGCTKANCEALLNCAVWVFPTVPCGSLPPGSESAETIHDRAMQGCIDVCSSRGDGTFLQCVADKFSGTTCTDIALDGGDRYESIGTTCFQGDDAGPCGAACAACESQCSQDTSDCNAACLDAGTTGACIDCNTKCGETKWSQCLATCPTN